MTIRLFLKLLFIKFPTLIKFLIKIKSFITIPIGKYLKHKKLIYQWIIYIRDLKIIIFFKNIIVFIPPFCFFIIFFYFTRFQFTFTNRTYTKRVIYFDVSDIYYAKNTNNGICRVVLSIYKNLEKYKDQFKVIPVVFDLRLNKSLFSICNLKTMQLESAIPRPVKDDIYLNLGITKILLPLFYLDIFNKFFKAKGVKILFTVHDLLPILHPEWWPFPTSFIHKLWIRSIAKVSDTLLSVSEKTQKDLIKYLNSFPHKKNIGYHFFHLGSDLHLTKYNNLIYKYKKINFNDLNFIHVSTIEPRKGHALLIDTFNILWKSGLKVNLIFVGTNGWKNKNILKKIKSNQYFNDKLFWFSDITDKDLVFLYKKTDILIHPSLGEGFGLSIVEGQNFNKYVICRDIEIFREVAIGEGVTFFNTNKPNKLSQIICNIINNNVLQKNFDIKKRSWSQTVDKLFNILNSDN